MGGDYPHHRCLEVDVMEYDRPPTAFDCSGRHFVVFAFAGDRFDWKQHDEGVFSGDFLCVVGRRIDKLCLDRKGSLFTLDGF